MTFMLFVLAAVAGEARAQSVDSSCVASTCSCPDGRQVRGGCNQDCAAICGATLAAPSVGYPSTEPRFNAVQQAQLNAAQDFGRLMGNALVNALFSRGSSDGGGYQRLQSHQAQQLLQYQQQLLREQELAQRESRRSPQETPHPRNDALNAALKDGADGTLALKDEGAGHDLAIKDADAEFTAEVENRRRAGFLEVVEKALRTQRESMMAHCEQFKVCWKSSMGQIDTFRDRKDLVERDLAYQKRQLDKAELDRDDGMSVDAAAPGRKSPIQVHREAIERDEQTIAGLKKFIDESRQGLDAEKPPQAIVLGGGPMAQVRGGDGVWKPLGARIFLRDGDGIRADAEKTVKLLLPDDTKTEVRPGAPFTIH